MTGMRELLLGYRRVFLFVAVFSFFVNLLQLAPTFYWMTVFDRVMTSRSESTLVYLTLGIVAALVLVMVIEMMRGRLLVVIAVWIDRDIAPRVFDALATQAGRPDYPPYPEGMRDLYVMRNYVTGTGIFSLFDIPWLPIYILIIFLFSPLLGLFSLIGAVALFIVGWINEQLSRDAMDSMYREMAVASRFVDIVMRNAESVLTLGMLSNTRKRWWSLNAQSTSHQVMTANVVGATVSLTRLVRQLVQIMMLCVGAYLILHEDTSPGVMIAATFIASRALMPVEMLLSGWAQMAEARAAYHRLDNFLRGVPPPPPARVALARPTGNVSVERLTLVVPTRQQPLLNGINFQVPAGQSVGIIGPSGSGKSTLARLLVGLWAPSAGAVRYDGAELTQWDRDELGRHVGYVPQQVELFSGTVAENIARMGELDSEEVIRAAKVAGVHDLILRLPNGYETHVSDGIGGLSGGQRQRIALARALYGSPSVVVMDEPNSNLDGEGEAALQSALDALRAAGTTVFVVAHRPSVLSSIDRVLMMRDGCLEAYGPRNEVLQRYVPGAQAPAGGNA